MDNHHWSHVRILCRRPALCVACNYRTLRGQPPLIFLHGGSIRGCRFAKVGSIPTARQK
ncbi:MAG: hypothetical protein IKI76_11065 [Selenomonadaceae bacterium]|nr:hypothetical protein [Selenomonadaceae bacterium]